MNVWALLFLLLPSSQAAPPPGQAAASAAVSAAAQGVVRGHVTAMGTGAPLKRAQVTLRGTQRQGDPLSTVTDAQGGFEFRNVEAGNYNLFGSKTGYISSGRADQGIAAISVRAGQEVNDVNLRLVRAGVISGVVTDEDGEPMANVNVQAFTRTFRRGQTTINPLNGAATDDRGQYRIYNLPPGRYYIQATPHGVFALPGQEAMVAYAPLFYPNASTLQDAQRVDLTGGAEVTRIDMAVRPVPTVTVSGRVMDGSSGKPATDSFVSIQGAEMNRGGSAGGQVRPDGSFRINGVVPGRARIMVMGRNREGGGRPYVRPIEIGNANISDLQIVLTPGVTVRGRVVADGGTAPANLRVTLMPRGDSLGGFGPAGGGGRVNPDLTFEVPNVQAGEYDVTLAGGGQGSAAYYVREVRKGSVNVLERGLTVGEGAGVNDVELILDFQPGSVSGKATDESGDPVSGTTVILLAADPTKRTQDRYFRTGRVDSMGAFRLSSVIPGDYLAILWPGTDPYQVQDPDVFGPLERHATRVTIEKAATATQDLKVVSQIRAAAQVVAQ